MPYRIPDPVYQQKRKLVKSMAGLNTYYKSINLADNELVNATNTILEGKTAIRKRNGWVVRGSRHPDGAKIIQGMGEYKTLSGTWKEWMAGNGKFYVRNRNTASWGAALKTGLDTSAKFGAQDFFSRKDSATQTGTATELAGERNLTDTGSSWTPANTYANNIVVIDGGTGKGQQRKILSSTTEVLTITESWTTLPDTTSTFSIYATENILYVGNGVDSCFSFNGTTASDVAAIPKGNILTKWQERLVVGNVASDQKTVHMSSIGNPENFTYDTTSTDISTPQYFVSNGGNVVGIAAYTLDNERLLVYTDKTLYDIIFSGGRFVVRERNLSVGTVSNRAITLMEGNPVTLATDLTVRVYGNFTGKSTSISFTEISLPIKDSLAALYNTSSVASVYHDDKLYILCDSTSAAANDTIYVYHLLYNAWTKWTGFTDFQTLAIVDDALCAGDSSGYVWELRTDSNAARFTDFTSTGISTTIQMKEDTDDNSDEKTYSTIRLWLRNEHDTATSLVVKTIHETQNGNLTTTTIGTYTIPVSATANNTFLQLPIMIRAISLQVQLTNSTAEHDVKLMKFEIGTTSTINRMNYSA